MRQLINFSSDPWSLAEFKDASDLKNFYISNGCDGIELILCGEDFENKIEPGMVIGLHLIFFPEWISLWKNDIDYLDKEFGNRKEWQNFYGVKNGVELLNYYRHELEVANKLGVKYVVFHMGDNRLDEFFNLKFKRSKEEQIDESCEFLNILFKNTNYKFDLLLENMIFGCMNLTDINLTKRVFEKIKYPHTGIMLDTGHFMSTNSSLNSMDEACEYIEEMINNHGNLAKKIWGVHLHASLSGDYISIMPIPPPCKEMKYLDRFSIAANHLSKIDKHQPFVSNKLHDLIIKIAPKYICHELQHGSSRKEWSEKLNLQINSLENKNLLNNKEFKYIEETKYTITPVSDTAREESKERWSKIAKPLGGLGRLENIITNIAALTGNKNYKIDKRAVVVFCSDNGVVNQSVTQTDADVTAVVAKNMTLGDTTVCNMSKISKADVIPVDIGMFENLNISGVLNRRVSAGTNDISLGPAMTREQALKGIRHGVDLVKDLKGKGYKIICTGEMGIGNTTTSAAVASVLLNCSPKMVTGRGAGLSSSGLKHKIEIIEKAISINNPNPKDPLDILEKLGGFDIAGLVGIFIGGGVYHVPIVIDGLISSVSALLAKYMYPECHMSMIASHVSAEPAGKMVLDALKLKPLITIDMYVGEGTGAVAILPLLDMAYSVYNNMPTFNQIKIDEYKPLK